MIFDKIKNYKKYKESGRVYEVLEFLAKTDFSNAELGKYYIDGDNAYYMVQEYDTKVGEEKCEAHQKYIDIQYVLDGEEIMGYADISCEKEFVSENIEKDCRLYKCETEKIKVGKGEFTIFYPCDIHSPGYAVDKPAKCRKIVAKIIAE